MDDTDNGGRIVAFKEECTNYFTLTNYETCFIITSGINSCHLIASLLIKSMILNTDHHSLSLSIKKKSIKEFEFVKV